MKALEVKALPQYKHIYYTQQLTFHHRDPFDRVLVAQSITDNMQIISADGVFDKSKAA